MVYSNNHPGPDDLPEEIKEQQPPNNPAQSPGPNHPAKEKIAPNTEGMPIEESDDEDDNHN